MQWKQMGGSTGRNVFLKLQIPPSIILGFQKQAPYGTCTEQFYCVWISIQNVQLHKEKDAGAI